MNGSWLVDGLDEKSGPITYPRWKELGRHVCKGQKAMLLCMPVTCKGKETATAADGTETETEVRFTRFVYRPNWFVLAQTEGADYQAPDIPDWKESDALQALKIEKIPFRMIDGNVQGYATRGRKVAINPVTPMSERIMFHEMAHVLLGHCEEGDLQDSDITPRETREMEAEGVALLCCESLGLEGSEYSRGYIQHWARGQNYTERSAQKIFHVADMILRAGKWNDAQNLECDAENLVKPGLASIRSRTWLCFPRGCQTLWLSGSFPGGKMRKRERIARARNAGSASGKVWTDAKRAAVRKNLERAWEVRRRGNRYVVLPRGIFAATLDKAKAEAREQSMEEIYARVEHCDSQRIVARFCNGVEITSVDYVELS